MYNTISDKRDTNCREGGNCIHDERSGMSLCSKIKGNIPQGEVCTKTDGQLSFKMRPQHLIFPQLKTVSNGSHSREDVTHASIYASSEADGCYFFLSIFLFKNTTIQTH